MLKAWPPYRMSGPPNPCPNPLARRANAGPTELLPSHLLFSPCAWRFTSSSSWPKKRARPCFSKKCLLDRPGRNKCAVSLRRPGGAANRLPRRRKWYNLSDGRGSDQESPQQMPVSYSPHIANIYHQRSDRGRVWQREKYATRNAPGNCSAHIPESYPPVMPANSEVVRARLGLQSRRQGRTNESPRIGKLAISSQQNRLPHARRRWAKHRPTNRSPAMPAPKSRSNNTSPATPAQRTKSKNRSPATPSQKKGSKSTRTARGLPEKKGRT